MYIGHLCDWRVKTGESLIFQESGWSEGALLLQEENQSEDWGKTASAGTLANSPFTSFSRQPSVSLQTSDRSDDNRVSVHPPEPN